MKWCNIEDLLQNNPVWGRGGNKVEGAHRWAKTYHELIIIEANWWVGT